MAGHCLRHPELSKNLLILWEPTHGSANRCGRRLTCVDMLRKDIGIKEKQDIITCTMDRDVWRKLCYTDAYIHLPYIYS